MKYFIILLFIVSISSSCNQGVNINDEKNYILVGTDSFYHVIAHKLFVNKYDTSKKIVILYSGDGVMISKGFYKGKLPNGIRENFFFDGKLMGTEFFVNGTKDEEQKEYFPNGKLKKIEKYITGKLISIENFDSSGIKIK